MQSTKEELTRRNAFEAVIRRPYFHVKPLDAAQLSAWSHYIDYMDAKGKEAETRAPVRALPGGMRQVYR